MSCTTAERLPEHMTGYAVIGGHGCMMTPTVSGQSWHAWQLFALKTWSTKLLLNQHFNFNSMQLHAITYLCRRAHGRNAEFPANTFSNCRKQEK
jgi:hypothetical protein